MLETRTQPVARISSVALAVLLVRAVAFSQTPQLAITAPMVGTVVTPGEAVTVTVSSPAGLSVSRVVIGGDDLHVGTSVPFSAVVIVPADTNAGVLEIDAMGVTATGEVVDAQSLALVVSEQRSVKALTAVDKTLRFDHPGYDLPIHVRAIFDDDTELDVTESPRVTYASASTAVAIVDSRGMVSAVGVGTTTITVSLAGSPAAVNTSVDVAVAAPTLAADQPSLQFGPQAVGTAQTRSLTFRNARGGPVSVFGVNAFGPFAATTNCLSLSPLAPDGTCSVDVTFVPTVSGQVRGVLTSTNSFDSLEAGLPLFGEGLGLRASGTTLGSSGNPSVLGQPVSFTATVTDASGGGAPVPTGEATFISGATTLGTAALTANGTATTSVSNLGVGSHSVVASYAGDNAYGPSMSAPFAQLVRYSGSGTCVGQPGHQILQPVNADGTSVFNQGRTVPAKFRVCNAAGQSIGTAGVVQDFRLTQIIAGTTSDVNETVPSTTPDTAFRWDASDQLWIFNISTSGQQAQQTYVYIITLNDGTTIGFRYGLR